MADPGSRRDPDAIDAPASYCPTCDRPFPLGTAVCPDDGTELVVLGGPDPLIDQVIAGRFKIVRRLGAGAMGVVYEALQTSLGRPVAIKMIKESDPAAERRFLREAKLASLLNHANIVTVYDFGKAGDRLYIAMELLDGPLLSDLLEREGRFSPARTVAIGAQLCSALGAAHGRGIVHRDLKPGNVILLGAGGDEQVKVLDFGLAKTLDPDQTSVSGPRQVVGTPAYMAPEVVLGGGYTAAGDLYAFGVLLYALAAGHRPFAGGDPTQLFRQHVHDPVPALPADVPEPLQRVIYRLLAKEPRDRFADAAATRAALLEAIGADTGSGWASGALGSSSTAGQAPAEPSYSLLVETPTVDLRGGLPDALRSPRRRWLLPVLVIAIAAVAAGVYALVRPRAGATGEDPPPAAAAPETPPAADTVPAAAVTTPITPDDGARPAEVPAIDAGPATAKRTGDERRPAKRSRSGPGRRERDRPAAGDRPSETFMEPP